MVVRVKPSREEVGAFLAAVEQVSDAMDASEATGWLVLVCDTEATGGRRYGKPDYAVGPFDTPEQALAYAGGLDRDDAQHGETGWLHLVIPQFPADEPAAAPEAEVSYPISVPQLRKLHATFRESGVSDRLLRLQYCEKIVGHPVDTMKDLTWAEASAVIDALGTSS